MENGTFAPREQMFHFSQYLKNLTFQRRPKVLVWSKWVSKSFECKIVNLSRIHQLKHVFWGLKRTISSRRFF